MIDYTVKYTKNNKIYYENIKAPSPKEALREINIKKLGKPLSATIQKQQSLILRLYKHITPKIKRGDLILFFSSLLQLYQSNITLVDAIKITLNTTPSKRFRAILQSVLHSLSSGKSLYLAFKDYELEVGSVVLTFLLSIDKNSDTKETLHSLIEYLQTKQKVSKSIKDALIYPSIVMIVMMVAIVIVIVGVIPRFQDMYESNLASLPIYTQILLDISLYIQDNWIVIITGFTATVITAVGLYQINNSVRLYIDKKIGRLPIVGSFVQSHELSIYFTILSHLGKNGVSIDKSLSIATQNLTNQYIKTELTKLTNRISIGYDYISAYNYTDFSIPTIKPIMHSASKSGNLNSGFSLVSQHLMQTLQSRQKLLSQTLEPLLLIGVGLLVLGLALAVFTPIWSLNSSF
jgi:MSHA biogenesis protein MshG